MSNDKLLAIGIYRAAGITQVDMNAHWACDHSHGKLRSSAKKIYMAILRSYREPALRQIQGAK